MDLHDTQLDNTKDEVKSLRAEILDLSIDNCSNFGDLVTYLDLLISHRSLINGTQINDDSVKALDTLLIWFSRAMQYLKQRKSVDYDFSRLEGRLEEIFYLIDDLHHSSLGAFSNALTILLKKLLQFSELMNCSDKYIINIVLRTQQRYATDKSYFVIIETILKLVAKSAEVISSHDVTLEEKCFKAMKHGALANSASKCISLYYRRLKDPRKASKEYIQLWSLKVKSGLQEEITKDKIIAHLIPMLFRDIPDQFLPWTCTLDINIKDPKWPRIMLPLFLAGLELSKANDPFNSIITESDVQRFLCDPNTKVRLGAFSFLTSTVHASSPPSKYISNVLGNSKLLDFIVQELQTPDDRTTFVFHLRNVLLKMKAYADKLHKNVKKNAYENTSDIQVLCNGIFNYVRSILVPDSSYAQLSIATEVASFLITDEFDGILRNPKLKNPGTKILEIYSKGFIRTLLRLSTNNYDDIRHKCSTMLLHCPYLELTRVLEELPILNSLKLVNGSKQGAGDSFAVLFLTIAQAHATHEPKAYIQLLSDVLANLESRCSKNAPICGSMAVLSSILGAANHSIVRDFHDNFKGVFCRLEKILDKQWSGFYSKNESADPQVGDHIDNWKNLKETAILIEALLNVNQVSDGDLMSECTFFEICESLMDALSSVTHRGTFTSILLAFMTCCTICFSGNLRALPKTWLNDNLTLVKTKKQLITRRSAGLPYLISGILVATSSQKRDIHEYMKLTIEELLSIATEAYDGCEESSVDLPHVNAFNCMTQIFKESALREHYKKFLSAALNASLDKLNHPVWAIKNGALMLFTALQNCFFGSNKLEDVTPSMKEELFFSQFPETKEILLHHLRNSNTASPNEAIPILSIVGRLQPSSTNTSLRPFIELIHYKYLGHRLWKIREIAAILIANMTKIDDISLVVDNYVPSLSTPKNETHGRLICILELLRRNRCRFPQSLKDSFKENKGVSHFSKWFILEVYIRIMDVCDLNLFDISIVNDAFEECVSTTEGLNGSSKLFIRTSLKFLLHHARDSTEREAFSQKFITKLKEAIHETALFWQQRIEEFQGLHLLHRQILETMRSDSLGAQVFKALLELVSKANLPVNERFEDSNWPDEWKCLNMAIEASSRSADLVRFTTKFREFSRDGQPENVRIKAVSAAKNLCTREADLNQELAELKLLLHEKESDGSQEVRMLAAPASFDFDNHLSWSKTFIAEFQTRAEGLLVESLINSIMCNVLTTREQLSNASFDIARENLYRNEVAVFSDYASALFNEKTEYTFNNREFRLDDLCECIEEVTNLVFENKSLIQSWTYNLHLDTAIRKVFALKNFLNDEKIQSSSNALFEFLHASNYPLELNDVN